jgi:hypothetical protein
VERADDDHYVSIAERLAAGRLIPFLGAGADLADRGDEPWEPGSAFPPSGAELAAYLAKRGSYPLPRDRDVLRVSQYVDAARGEDELYRYLREALGVEYEPSSLHRLLARVARHLDEVRLPQLLVVTTSVDDRIERALDAEGLDCDVVWYDARQGSPARGRFQHRAPGEDPVAIARPNKYTGIPVGLVRPAVLKLHGCLDRDDPGDDSYVVTEDDTVHYLAAGDLGALIPIALRQRMTSTGFLFVGYALRDWSLRVLLDRLRSGQGPVVRSWAVEQQPGDPKVSRIERALWGRREGVELVYCGLDEYARELEARMPFAVETAAPAG